MNYSERDYFRYLQSHDTRDVFIGQPVRSKVDGSLNITVSRRVNDRDGSFAGVVVTSVSMQFFRKLFETLQPSPAASSNWSRTTARCSPAAPLPPATANSRR